MHTTTQSPRLKNMSQKEIETLMLKEKLLNMAKIGAYFDISRERVRQIFKEKGIDFKQFKKSITITIHQQNISLKGEVWKLIDFYETAHKYYVSNKGRVSRELNKTINGTTFVQKKLLNPSSGKCKRLRVNLSLINPNSSKNKPRTVYVHSLVTKSFHGLNEKSRGVKHNNKDVTDNNSTNVSWH